MAPKTKGAAGFDNSENHLDTHLMRDIFHKIDLDKNGTLDIGELEAASRELGIKCSKNSMRKIFKMIDVDGSGAIDFDEFFVFFGQISDPEKMKSLLSSANQAFYDYRQRVEDDPNFAKDFPFPRSTNPTQRYEFNESNVESVLWAPNDQVCAVTADGLLLLWDSSERGKRLAPKTKTFFGQTGVYCAEGIFGGGSEKLLVGFGKKQDNLWLWDMATSTPLSKVSADEASIYSCAVHGTTAVSGSQIGNLSFVDLNRSDVVSKYEVHEGVIYSCAFNERGNTLCTASKDGNCHLIDPRQSYPGCLTATLEDASAGYSCNKALFVNDNELLIAGEDFCIKRWDIRNCSAPPVACYLGHTTHVKALALSEDRTLFASGAFDGSVRVWFVDADGLKARSAGAPAPIEKSLAELREEYERVADLVREGEADPREAQAIQAHIKKYEGEGVAEDDAPGFKRGSHSLARLDLAGHRMACQTLAWKTGAASSMVLSGSQDESASYYEVDSRALLASLVEN